MQPVPPMNEQVKPVAQKKETILLECVACRNTDTLEGAVSRLNYPGSCGHCGNPFRVIKK